VPATGYAEKRRRRGIYIFTAAPNMAGRWVIFWLSCTELA
jgi:hypothetical protein